MSKPAQISFKEFYPLAFPEPVEPIVCAPSQETPVRGLAAPSEVRARIRAERLALYAELDTLRRPMANSGRPMLTAPGCLPSNGWFVLAERCNILSGFIGGASPLSERFERLRGHAATAIGAGC